MAITSGFGNKRQVYLAVGLCSLVAGLGSWELFGSAASAGAIPVLEPTSTAKRPPITDRARAADASPGPLRLRTDELANSEGMDYALEGRDVFQTDLPRAMEAPAAPARPVEAAIPAAPRRSMEPPSMEMKYLGFAETDRGKLTGVFMHGAEFLPARTGDIVFHRFRVGVIQATTAQITDLASNETRNIPAASDDEVGK